MVTAWSTDLVASFSLSTPYDLSNDSATHTGSAKATTPLTSHPFWGSDGTTYYVRAATDTLFEWTCAGDPYIITSADTQTHSFTDTEAGQTSSSDGLTTIARDGSRVLWGILNTQRWMSNITMSTPNDLSTTATPVEEDIVTSIGSHGSQDAHSMIVSKDGMAMYWSAGIEGGIRKFNFGTAYDFTTITEEGTIDAGISRDWIDVSHDATKIIGGEKFTANWYEYTL